MINNLVNSGLKLSYKIAQLLVKTKIKPIWITLLRFVIVVPISLYFFSQDKYIYNVIGLFLYMFLAILDWVDGDMAQIYKLPKETAPLGRLIDHNADRILMLIVLGSILYANISTHYNQGWIITTILYYSIYFFLTVLLFDFDKLFNLEFDDYPKIEKEMNSINPSPKASDKILYNFLYVHKNSLMSICFTHSYLLVMGILTNQLFPMFVFITLMNGIRSVCIFVILCRVLKTGKTNSVLIQALRKIKTS